MAHSYFYSAHMEHFSVRPLSAILLSNWLSWPFTLLKRPKALSILSFYNTNSRGGFWDFENATSASSDHSPLFLTVCANLCFCFTLLSTLSDFLGTLLFSLVLLNAHLPYWVLISTVANSLPGKVKNLIQKYKAFRKHVHPFTRIHTLELYFSFFCRWFYFLIQQFNQSELEKLQCQSCSASARRFFQHMSFNAIKWGLHITDNWLHVYIATAFSKHRLEHVCRIIIYDRMWYVTLFLKRNILRLSLNHFHCLYVGVVTQTTWWALLMVPLRLKVDGWFKYICIGPLTAFSFLFTWTSLSQH